MENNGVEIVDTFAEGFGIKVSRMIITAATKHLAEIAATEATGYGTSVIGCPAEAGIDHYVPPTETPDGRPGFAIMICHMSKKSLDNELMERIGQCVLTAPTAAAFNALDSEDSFKTGNKLRFFGDGYETEVEVNGRKMQSIPIMSGDFLVEDTMGWKEGVAGGNFFIMADSQLSAVTAAEAAADAIKSVPGVITPFPGGMVASGSKVGSKYKFMNASTNEKVCVTLKDKVETELPDNVFGMMEIVIDGLDEESVSAAMKAGIEAACQVSGVLRIGAGNYGGDLGPYHFHLKEL
ncbi:MAG: formylmethanofuran--tetrahydromethanopterin N-formyltransferase [Methanobrevibacter boviskoreani]|jgi:formylmethanofuran--tetrahydromethanopterin N-formyltransferase|uniref:formylmethanofuran--tetrahydromethanopterin N-formyltransferase n=1 Tax=Methanobrevibacter TaxID=2172 RepID=UPI000334840B|nr:MULTISPECIES: formylmethanofuran--tetrahydromethanopterin N-formyltransferase [Methanobrevibacter]AGN17467.1 formylmethanofuran-tetrahydromethanopterin formyltransferase Ftr2 [Methanobrevibacter sp. AbM4]MCI6775510.1 formylmethanofuran--tetrahydromethanopterin N-formyltransferase [Methanobrevibacter boviskoreani]MCI6930413.1 formylmethanofuran--tetrahydromethanopterin N-formyltransferase [Methanobrevibacter boviskoreani]MDD6256860.1 formylmethanofuran--tetrahydromethanopterin N-formyltransfe